MKKMLSDEDDFEKQIRLANESDKTCEAPAVLSLLNHV